MSRILRLGAFDVSLEEGSGPYRDLLEGLFRTRASAASVDAPVDLSLTVSSAGDRSVFGKNDALESRKHGNRTSFSSDVVVAELECGTTPRHLMLWIDDSHPRACYLDHYLRIVLNAVFRRLERVRFHAAAVDFAGSTSLFIGDKGAGKTTICLQLAQAGGTVLGEDQVMVRRTAEGVYCAAGGDTLMRLTAGTESFFFRDPLPEAAVVLAGVQKKEIRGRDYINFTANREHPPKRIFFPKVRRRLTARRLSRGEALSRLAAPLTPVHRFTDDADRRQFLAFLLGLTSQAESYSLSLSPELADLDGLAGLLK